MTQYNVNEHIAWETSRFVGAESGAINIGLVTAEFETEEDRATWSYFGRNLMKLVKRSGGLPAVEGLAVDRENSA